VRDKGLSLKDEVRVDTDTGQLVLKFDIDGQITVNMGIPRHKPAEIPLRADQEAMTYRVTSGEEEYFFGAVSMGNPHAVLQVEDVDSAPVATVGRLLESHNIFPERANIGFMQIVDRKHIKLRVYERGAAETLACGSGACAAAVVAIEQNLADHQVLVQLPGGPLRISWTGRGKPVMMTGPAISVFEGTINL
ncbi:MAG TPA: diaminopimelate epimerase, partial [Methylomicrobium sp.]|nr:diaminopimelate epimerase [Methylomicrobium sp.]